MEIYALYGPSGTGKSTSALALAHKHQITAIIDDGLLIVKGKKVAGKSAKYERTTVQAVKRAIFFSKEHAEEVKQELHCHDIKRLLILGTSKKMVNRIQAALALPAIKHYVNITDIRSSAEIKAALYDRGMLGRHLIPIPHVQVEQDFVRRLIDQVDRLFTPKKESWGETTIVHPRFHTGGIHVSEQALKKLVINSCRGISSVSQINRIKVDFAGIPKVELDLSMVLELGANIRLETETIQRSIFLSFQTYLELELENINLHITQVVIKSSPKQHAEAFPAS